MTAELNAYPNVSTYEMVEGTRPSMDEPHEPRLLTRTTRNEGLVQMMSEIGDGLFVAWGSCSRCHETVQQCKCAFGPVEPGYIQKWRDERFETSVQKRFTEPEPEDDTFSRPLSSPIRRTTFSEPTVTPHGDAIDRAMSEALEAVRAATCVSCGGPIDECDCGGEGSE